MANRKFYTGVPTNHQPRFYAAPNFLKMRIILPTFVVFWTISTIRTKSLLQSFINKNCQRQSCCAINCLSSGINTQWTRKKRGSLFVSITLANLNRFYSFYIVLIAKKFYITFFVVHCVYWQGDDPFPWNLGSKWPTAYWRQRVLTHFAL